VDTRPGPVDDRHLRRIPFYTLLLQEASPHAQLVGVSDDLGSQQGLIFSPQTFRSIFKPLLKRLVDHIHSLADVRVYMHSDGAIYDLIPDLIEAGVEGLNPVQYTARGMELGRLKREFGNDLGFFGGTLERGAGLRHPRCHPPEGAGQHRHARPGRRVPVRLDPQHHPGGATREHRRLVRGRIGVRNL
jgi:hypothetical protein